MRNIPDAKLGDTIKYRLPLSSQPVDPDYLWSGIVITVYKDYLQRVKEYTVTSVEHPDCLETVYLYQVMEVIPATVEQVEDT